MGQDVAKHIVAFEEDAAPVYGQSAIPAEDRLLLDIDGYDGPLDMLLNLARDQKVDLTQISILALANQYLDFIESAKQLRLELAADYLVMAAWLAYLKSRLLIPQDEVESDEPTGAEMAEALAFQLRRLEAMRDAGEKLMMRPQLGSHIFARGLAGELKMRTRSVHEAELYDLLTAYGDIQRRQEQSTYRVKPFELMSIEQALERIQAMLGRIPGDWMDLTGFLPGKTAQTKTVRRSVIASTIGASLEMAKQGLIEIRQEGLYAPVYIRMRRNEEERDCQ